MTNSTKSAVTKAHLQEHLRKLDKSRVFLRYFVHFKPSSIEHTTVSYDSIELNITLSQRWTTAPLEVVEELVEYAFRRTQGEKIPPFGPLVRKHLRKITPRRNDHPLVAQELRTPTIAPTAVRAVIAEYPFLKRISKTVGFQWSIGSSSNGRPLATRDMNTRCVMLDRFLKSRDLFPIVAEYVVFHELAIFKCWDYKKFRCDVKKLEEMLSGFRQRQLVLMILEIKHWSLSYVT